MKILTVETLSIEELAARGYKDGGYRWYLGHAKYPTATISKNLEPLLGQTLDVVSINDERERLTVEYLGESYFVPFLILKKRFKAPKVHRKMVGDEVVKFNGINFNFPCSLQRANWKDARAMAEWVLRVTK